MSLGQELLSFIVSRRVIPCHVMSCDMMSCHVMLCRVRFFHIVDKSR